MSSSIPSWQILTAHAQPFRGTRDLAFCLKVPLDSLLVWASSEGSGETARMRRLAWTFAARIGDKYQIRLTRSNYNLQTWKYFIFLCCNDKEQCPTVFLNIYSWILLIFKFLLCVSTFPISRVYMLIFPIQRALPPFPKYWKGTLTPLAVVYRGCRIAWVPVWAVFLVYTGLSLVKNDSLVNFDFEEQRHLDYRIDFVGSDQERYLCPIICESSIISYRYSYSLFATYSVTALAQCASFIVSVYFLQ